MLRHDRYHSTLSVVAEQSGGQRLDQDEGDKRRRKLVERRRNRLRVDNVKDESEEDDGWATVSASAV